MIRKSISASLVLACLGGCGGPVHAPEVLRVALSICDNNGGLRGVSFITYDSDVQIRAACIDGTAISKMARRE